MVVVKFDDFDTYQQNPPVGGVQFSNTEAPVKTQGVQFNDDDFNSSQAPQGGFFKRTVKSLGGTIGAVGKVLTAPQAATTALTEQGLEATGVLKQTNVDFGKAVNESKSNIELLKRVGTETGKGGVLTGQYKATESVFGNFIRELPSATIGTAADLIFDPLNYFNPFKAAGKVLKTANELTGASEISAVQKVGDMLGQAYKASSQKIFGVDNALAVRSGQSEAFTQLDRERKIAESAIQERVSKIVSPVIDRPAVIQQRIAQIIKGGVTSDADIKTLAEPIRQELDRVGESISKLNPKLLSEDTFAANKGTYFPRLYSDFEFQKEDDLIQQAFASPRAVSIPKEPFMKRTLTETESLARGNRIEEAGYPALKRLTQLNVAEQRQKFYSEAAKLASNDPKPGWIQMSDDKSLGTLAGKFLPAAEYKAISDIRHIPTGGERIYLNALGVWKTFKTAWNPSTIARNDLTNFFVLNPLGGVGPHRLDIYARTFNEMMTKGPLYQAARNQGLEISTQQAAELTNKATRFYRENGGLVKQFFGKIGDFHQAVKNFYGSQDKFFKLANFIKGKTEDGLTDFEALRRANFYLVDYSEVPEAVAWLRKQPFGVPFISFAYGVSKPLAKTLLDSPQKLGAYFKILNGIQQMNPMGETPAERQAELDVLPEWIQEGTYLRLPVKDKYGRGQYVDLQYILPFNIIESRSIQPGNPVFSILTALITNKNTFTGKDITQTTDSPSEKFMKQVTQALSILLPPFTPFIGTSYKKAEALLRNRPDANGFVRKTIPVLADILAGIKVTPIDPTVEAQKRAGEKRRELDELETQLRSIMLNKTLFPDEKEQQAEEIRTKLQNVIQ